MSGGRGAVTGGLCAATIALIAACGSHAKSGTDLPAANGGGLDGGVSDAGTPVDAGDAGVSDAGNPIDGGDIVDGGAVTDAGSVDAGPAVDACVASDAGVPVTLEVLPCPQAPALLWRRTFPSVDVSFYGRVDPDGNLYWVEYDPPWSYQNPDPPAFLVSAKSTDGENRYRVSLPGASVATLMIAAGHVILSQQLVVTAYETATGVRSWSLDLSSPQPTGYDEIASMTDLGDGRIAFTRYSEAEGKTTLYVVDASSGAVVWAPESPAYQVLGSNGAGLMLVTSNASTNYSPYETIGDVSVLDSSGHESWKERIAFSSFLGWSSAKPWLGGPEHSGVCSTSKYTALPPWWGQAQGGGLGFAFSFGTAQDPDNIQVLRGDAVVGIGPLAGSNSDDGLEVIPFMAGDHLDMLGQVWRSQPALCYPSRPAAAWFARVDASALYQCPLAFAGDSGIEGAALLPGRLIVGRRTYSSYACGSGLNPVTIEAYALPGESLSTSGWVQWGGSPGGGNRPLLP